MLKIFGFQSRTCGPRPWPVPRVVGGSGAGRGQLKIHAPLGAWLVLLAVLAGCATGGSPALSDKEIDRAAEAEPLPPVSIGPYRLGYGDRLQIRLTYRPDLDESVPVRPDGRIALRMIGEVDAAGLTSEQLASVLRKRYSAFLRDPDIVVIVVGFAPAEIYVGGEVRQPGMLTTTGKLTALQAILAVGGFKDSAELRNVIILRDQGTEVPGFMLLDVRDRLTSPGGGQDVVLAPRDIVFVPKTRIAKLGQAVKEYYRDIMPMATSLNATYVFGPGFTP